MPSQEGNVRYTEDVATTGLRLSKAQWIFFVLSPLLNFLFFWIIPFERNKSQSFQFFSMEFVSLVTIVTAGHIAAVYFRALRDPVVRNQTLRKTILSTVIIFSFVLSSPLGYAAGFFAFLFWIHYHYFRQHFGISRILTSKELLASKGERWNDIFFTTTVYTVPLLAVDPLKSFKPELIQLLIETMGLPTLGYFTMLTLEWSVKLSQELMLFFIVFWTCYILRLFFLSSKRREFLPKAVFSASLALGLGFSYYVLSPALALLSVVALHSIQYYFIVGADQVRNEISRPKRIFWAFAPLLVGYIVGFWTVLIPLPKFLVDGLFIDRIGGGFVIALNLAHFYIDGYVWRKYPGPMKTR